MMNIDMIDMDEGYAPLERPTYRTVRKRCDRRTVCDRYSVTGILGASTSHKARAIQLHYVP